MTDVGIVGGGVIGLACAWRAAQRGSSVTLFDPTPGQGASHVAAGMLGAVGEVQYGELPLLALSADSARRWPAFAAELSTASGIDVGYRTEGTLGVASDGDDLRVLDELVAFQRSLGLGAERLGRRECREMEPRLSPRVRGGVFVAGDHQVDSRRVVEALLAVCARQGVDIQPRRIESLADIDADRVVVATGSWSAALAPEVPVRPVKGQILRLRFDPAHAPLIRTVRGLAGGRSVYLVPRLGGELVVGATVEEAGFDTAITAGAVHDLLRAAIDLVPGVGELELVETRAGLRPGTPDNAPVIGRSRHDARVVFATGHHRNGILLTPVTADAVTALLAGDSVPPVVAPFGVERFER